MEISPSSQSKACKLYDPLNGKVLISRDVVFNENASWDFTYGKEISGDPIPLIDDVPNGETTPPTTRTNSTNSSPSNIPTSTLAHTRNNSSSSNTSSSSSSSDSPLLKTKTLDDIYADPRAEPYALYASDHVSFKEAVERQEWKQAIKEDMQAIERNHTWELVDLLNDKSPIGLKWLFRTKFNTDGSVQKHKARLVAKGYAQQQGVDFDKTFSPVARFETVRILLSLAAHLNWPVYQFDVKSSFLNGELEEEVDDGIFVSQRKYAKCLLSKFGMQNCNGEATPMNPKEKYLHTPTMHHLGAATRVLRYVAETTDFIWYSRASNFNLFGYSDSDWGGEAEYIAVTSEACQAVWLRRLLNDLHKEQQGFTILFCDNKATITMTKNPAFHNRTKHIDIRYHFIRTLAAKGEIVLKYYGTKEQVVDLLTKSISSSQHAYLRKRLGVCHPLLSVEKAAGNGIRIRKAEPLGKRCRAERGGPQGRDAPQPAKIINMIRVSPVEDKKRKAHETTEAWMHIPITFPPISSEDVLDEPLIVEAEVEGYLVRRVYVDEGSSVEVMFEHCFDNLNPGIKARLKETQTNLVGFAREILAILNVYIFGRTNNQKIHQYAKRA
ncbi:retrovirus-related pol polyprotein from transposon TNT 1-94 [Tanacetum coccineum]